MALKKTRSCIVLAEAGETDADKDSQIFYAAFAVSLARDDHDVAILVYDQRSLANELEVQEYYKAKSIKFCYLYEHINFDHYFDMPKSKSSSFAVMQWLLQNDGLFDVVYFPSLNGIGYYSLLAKHQGWAFQKTEMAVGVNGSSFWNKEANRVLPTHIRDVEYHFMEKESVRLADAIFSYSQYMLEWLKNRKWLLPKHICVRPPILFEPCRKTSSSETPIKINEFVFYGDWDETKGAVFFCDSIDRSNLKERRDIRITFLGRNLWLRGMRSRDYLFKRAGKWKCKIHFEETDSRESMSAYMRMNSRLAIIPSLIDDFPYTVLECLVSGTPFLTSDVGGIPEMISGDSRHKVCITPFPDLWADALSGIADEGAYPVAASFDFQENERQWISWHSNLANKTKDEPITPVFQTALPLVTIVLIHFNRPTYLQQAIASIENQDYKNFEVILVDCGSRLPSAISFLKSLEEKFSVKGWKILYDKDRYLGAARNLGVSHSQGEYIMFMDDDNYALPDEISTFVAVAQKTNADILTCAKSVFSSEEKPDLNNKGKISVPLGGALTRGVFSNVFGDSNCFVKKASFKALGGFTEDFGVGNEDGEFFARACLKGMYLLPIPKALYWYRINPEGISNATHYLKNANRLRGLRPYSAVLEKEGLGDLATLALGVWTGGGLSDENPQELVDMYWDSTTWRIALFFRNIVNFIRGMPSEKRPIAQNFGDAYQIVHQILDSTLWNLLGPVRVLIRLLKGCLSVFR